MRLCIVVLEFSIKRPDLSHNLKKCHTTTSTFQSPSQSLILEP